jgi:molybdopterin synthase catalytic subunit
MTATDKPARRKTMFIDGPVAAGFIADSISKHAGNHSIGAHEIFLGQIREDVVDGKKVTAIDFTAYLEMADEAYVAFRETLFSRYSLTCMHVHHSLGPVRVGEINLFVFVSSRHRKDAMAACRELVEWIKSHAPVWGKLLFDDSTHDWKTNTPAFG